MERKYPVLVYYHQFFIYCFLLLIVALPFSSIRAQWSSTGLGGGHINTVFVNGSDLFTGFNGNGGSIAISGDQGVSWYSSTTGLVSGSDVRAFAANTTDVFTGTTNGVYRSSSSGSYNWTKVLDNVSCFALLTNGTTIFAGTMGGGVYISTDNGNNWNQVNNGLTMLHVYALARNGSYLFAGTYHDGITNGQGVFRSSDNGQNWTAVNNGMSPTTTIMSLAVMDGFVFAGTNGQGVYRSSDNGDNWTNVASGIAHTLKVVCGNEIYAGFLSFGGIIRSIDNGNTWTDVSNGLPVTGGYSVMSLTASSTHLFAGTLGGGVARMEKECTPEPNACIRWDLMSSTALSSTTGNISGSPEVIQGMSVFGNSPYTANGQQLWMTNTGWPAGGMDPTRYLEFNSTANSGNNLTIESVSFNYGDNPLTTDFNILNSRVFYSTDYWATSQELTTSALNYLNTSMQQFTASGINEVINSGQIFSVRIYPYAPNGSLSMTPSFAVHNSVAICGTTSAATPQTGSIKIIKDAVPDNSQSFFFLFGNSGGSFVLDDDGGSSSTYLNHTTLAGISTGVWTITENAVPGWTLTNISSVPSNGSVYDLANRSVTVYLTGGANVVCTFTNTLDINTSTRDNLSPDGNSQIMEQNAPNPFAQTSIIKYNIMQPGHVILRVYNSVGETVKVLVNENQSAGRHEVTLDASQLSNGIYFYSIQAENILQTRKMMILK